MVRTVSKTGIMVALGGLAVVLGGVTAVAQRVTPAEAAAKLSGSWQMNLELSPQFAPRGGGAPGGMRGASQQRFALGAAAGSVRTTTAFQRGGRGGGGAAGGAAMPMSDADRAGAAYMNTLQGAASSMTIKATADSVTFADPRGERSYVIDNKNTKLSVGSVALSTKSRWDRLTLKQEFVYGETRITHDWEVNAEGTRINFKMLIQNMASEGPPREAKAVYDKQP